MNCEGNLKDMTPSRIQFSVITKLICLRSEDLDCVALFFIKHGAEVCKKFYLQFLLNREAACLSRKCVNVFTNTYGNDEKAGNLREIPQNGQGVI